MKAMILAAGLGTRLQPLTFNKPKALVEVGGCTMLDIGIRYLQKYGVTNIVINIHHFADQIEDFIKWKNYKGISFSFSDERNELLDTGGAIKHAAHLLRGNTPFILMGVDILTSLNLSEMLSYHIQNKAMVTLAVKQRETSRSLLFDKSLRLAGWRNNITHELRGCHSDTGLTALGFSVIHIIEPSFLDLIIETGKFSILDPYFRCLESQKIMGYRHDADPWIEFGRADQLSTIESSSVFKELMATL